MRIHLINQHPLLTFQGKCSTLRLEVRLKVCYIIDIDCDYGGFEYYGILDYDSRSRWALRSEIITGIAEEEHTMVIL